MTQAQIFAVSRHRLTTDGEGVTTLVTFNGCPLRCKYCLNKTSWDAAKGRFYTPEELYEIVKIDQLYFLATKGGVTFGGGEPLVHADFIAAFRTVCPREWHLCAETSLHVPADNVRTAAGCVDHFFVDVKDTDPEIYRAYTGRDNQTVLENLSLLLSLTGPDRVTVRVPLIPGYNDEAARERSLSLLYSMGVTHTDCFTYKMPKQSGQ